MLSCKQTVHARCWAHSELSTAFTVQCGRPIQIYLQNLQRNALSPSEPVKTICQGAMGTFGIIDAAMKCLGTIQNCRKECLDPSRNYRKDLHRIVWSHLDQSGPLARECLGPIRNCWKDLPQNLMGPFRRIGRIC